MVVSSREMPHTIASALPVTMATEMWIHIGETTDADRHEDAHEIAHATQRRECGQIGEMPRCETLA